MNINTHSTQHFLKIPKILLFLFFNMVSLFSNAQCPTGTVRITCLNDCNVPLCNYPVTVIQSSATDPGLHAENFSTFCYPASSTSPAISSTCFPWSSFRDPSLYISYNFTPGTYTQTRCCQSATPTSTCAVATPTSLVVTNSYYTSASTNYEGSIKITNPYQPKYTVGGLTLDMTTTKNLYKCTSTATIPMVNNTNTYGTSVVYKVRILNSNEFKLLGTEVGTPTTLFSSAMPTTLPKLANLATTQYYIIEVWARCTGSTTEGCVTRGHFRYMGVTPTLTSNFNINGETLATSANASAMPNFYACNAINFNNTSTGIWYKYKIEIDEVNTAGAVISGSTSGLVSALFITPPATTIQNLGTLFPILTTNGGGKLFRLKQTIYDNCTNYTSTKYMRLSSVPGSVKFTYGASDQPLNPSTLPITAPLVSKQSARFSYLPDPSLTSGSISSYSMSITKVNCTTGVAVSPAVSLPTTTTTLSPPQPTLSSVMWNNIFAGLFATNFNAGDCGKAIITLTNPCGSVVHTSYFKLGTLDYGRLSSNEIAEESSIAIYPTNAHDNLTCEIKSIQNEESNLLIYNVQGQLMQTQNLGLLSNTATNYFDVNISTLPAGIYLYRLSNDNRLTGKFIKN
jgi:hypothetical protein